MTDLVVPPLGESITEAVVSRWLKQVGDAVADGRAGRRARDRQGDRAAAEPGGRRARRAARGAGADGEGRRGDRRGDRGRGGQAGRRKPAPPVVSAPMPTAPTQPLPLATPHRADADDAGRCAAATAASTGIALMRLSPSQRAAAREAGSMPSPSPAPSPSPSPSPRRLRADRLASLDPRDEVVPMSPLRKRVAERLVQAQHESASLTTFNEVDMTAVMEHARAATRTRSRRRTA